MYWAPTALPALPESEARYPGPVPDKRSPAHPPPARAVPTPIKVRHWSQLFLPERTAHARAMLASKLLSGRCTMDELLFIDFENMRNIDLTAVPGRSGRNHHLPSVAAAARRSCVAALRYRVASS